MRSSLLCFRPGCSGGPVHPKTLIVDVGDIGRQSRIKVIRVTVKVREQALDRPGSEGVSSITPTLLSFFFVFVFFHIPPPLIIFNWISEEVLTTHHTHSTSCFCLYVYAMVFPSSLFTRFNLLFGVVISIDHWIVFSHTTFSLLSPFRVSKCDVDDTNLTSSKDDINL